MKKFILTFALAIIATMASAQFLDKPNGGAGASSAGAPVAEGLFVVSAAAGAYAYFRKKRD